MPFNANCFRDCVNRNTKWYVWLTIGIVAVVAFLLAYVTWGLSVVAALAWAIGAGGASIGGVLAMCYLRCR